MSSSELHFYCHPKPWIDDFVSIQHAAVTSWLAIGAQVTLLGTDEGTAEWAAKLGARYIPDIERNEWGTPLVSSIFNIIRGDGADKDVCCYINADIVLGDDFRVAVEVVAARAAELKEDEWLMVGNRTDLQLADRFRPTQYSVAVIQDLARQQGRDHGPSGIDYFVFPRSTFSFVYAFALGKFVWDQWLVGNAFRRGLFTVDCSKAVLAVHLNCPWFFRGGATTDRQVIHDSEEGTRNRSFDYYQKTIASGTMWLYDGKKFERKTWVPDN